MSHQCQKLYPVAEIGERTKDINTVISERAHDAFSNIKDLNNDNLHPLRKIRMTFCDKIYGYTMPYFIFRFNSNPIRIIYFQWKRNEENIYIYI